jgi:exonuclease SbcC
MIPILLRVSGFLSYRDPVELDFSSIELACIAGPNGAGKSSLLDAITWALFGQARKRDESLINSHPDVKAAEVTLVFAYEDNIYRVMRANSRGKTTQLEFQILQDRQRWSLGMSPVLLDGSGLWKPLTEHNLRETQTRIENV